jgi:hypothetical protein
MELDRARKQKRRWAGRGAYLIAEKQENFMLRAYLCEKLRRSFA